MNNEKLTNQNKEQEEIIDDSKLRLIIKNIIELENENVKTRELNDDAIKKKIEKIMGQEKLLLHKLFNGYCMEEQKDLRTNLY